MRCHLDGGDRGAALRRQGAQQCGLTTRSGAEVEPAFAVGCRLRVHERGRDQLTALVLDVCPAVHDRADVPGCAAGKVHRVRGVPADLSVALGGQLVRGDPAGTGAQVHRRGLVVGLERRPRLVQGPQPVVERAHHPLRVRRRQRQPAHRVGWGERVHPGVPVALGDPAQHGVGEPGRARVQRAHEVDRGGHRGVRRYPGTQELVGTEP